MKYLLFGYHKQLANVLCTVYKVLFAHFGLKTTSFLNTHKNYRYKASALKLTDEKLIFNQVRGPNFWRAQVEK